jgi:tetratricopeptide (TPR) repeat protein
VYFSAPKLAEASKQYDKLVNRENEEVEKAKTAPPDFGRYLLSTSKPPIRPLTQHTEDEDDEKSPGGGDPDDGWTPDPNSPFSNALYYYGSERWHEARAAFEEALQKTELSQHGQTEDREDRAVTSSKAVAEAASEAAAEAEVEPKPEPEPSPGPPGTEPEPKPEPKTQPEPAPEQLAPEVAEAPAALGVPSGEEGEPSSDFRARCLNGIGLCWMMENRFSDGLDSFNRAIAAGPSAPAA